MRRRRAPAGSAPWLRECALLLASIAPWVPATGAAGGVWLLLPAAAVAHTALDPTAPGRWRAAAGVAFAVAGGAALATPWFAPGVTVAAVALFAALAAEVAAHDTKLSRYQPGRT